MELSQSERSQRARLASLTSWANTENRSARTAPARRGLEEKFLREAGGDPLRAEALRKAHFARLAYRSARARKRRGATNRPDPTGPGAR